MRRTATTMLVATLTATAAAVALAAPASAHDADTPHWHTVPDQPPFEMEACGTTVTFDEEVNEVREMVIETEDGVLFRYRGRLTIRMTTDDGRSALLDASGPADIRDRGGKVDVALRGMTLLLAGDEAAAALHEKAGLPAVALVKGLVRIHDEYDEEGSLVSTDFVSLPRPGRRIVDACTLLEPNETL